MAALCRNTLHPLSERTVRSNGRTECSGCAADWHRARDASASGGRDRWADPVADAERAARLRAWQTSVDAAIAEMRATEGFDSSEREWTTLGECLPPEPRRLSVAPAPVARRTPVARFKPARAEVPGVIGGHPFVRCERCRKPRFVGRDCASCAAGLVRRLVS